MTDIRMKIAAGATILGLGGLAGFAMGSNPAGESQAVDAAANQARPKAQTEVVRRTIHVNPRSDGPAGSATPSAGAIAASSAPSTAPAPPAPAATVVSNPSPQSVSTGRNGAASNGGDVEDDDEEYELERDDEFEGEGEDD